MQLSKAWKGPTDSAPRTMSFKFLRICLYTALNKTPNVDRYRVGAVPKVYELLSLLPALFNGFRV